MALTMTEGLENGGKLLLKLAEATTEESEGGATITKDEMINIVTETLTSLGIDVVD